ncbi:MAG: nucleotidyltransferase domain-containing protein, partial [Desulfovibrio sp.]|nr:nucleotidyltransferase domain-containing protein [Desulfovibrio sp.]
MRMNLEKISPIKRAKIEKGIDLVEQCNENEKIIEKMIIFGSSVTNHCTEDSDIDVCLVSDYTTANNAYFRVHSGLGRVMDDVVDIFNFKRIVEKLKNEISKKGIIVYK